MTVDSSFCTYCNDTGLCPKCQGLGFCPKCGGNGCKKCGGHGVCSKCDAMAKAITPGVAVMVWQKLRSTNFNEERPDEKMGCRLVRGPNFSGLY